MFPEDFFLIWQKESILKSPMICKYFLVISHVILAAHGFDGTQTAAFMRQVCGIWKDTSSGMPVVSGFASKAPGEVALAAHLYPLLSVYSNTLYNALCESICMKSGNHYRHDKYFLKMVLISNCLVFT